VLSGDQPAHRLDARDESVKGLLDAHRARLAEALDAAGTPLSTLHHPRRWPRMMDKDKPHAPPERRRARLRRRRAAPKVVAKGKGLVAEQIIERARDAGVFVHESKELVALLMDVDLDRQIPPALYRAIAELLAWLYHIESAQTRPAHHPRTGHGAARLLHLKKALRLAEQMQAIMTPNWKTGTTTRSSRAGRSWRCCARSPKRTS
jgi:flagellar biosynthesis protein